MPVGPDELRRTVRRFASGVTIVTVSNDDGCHGMTASSFASVSLTPPMVLVALEESSTTRKIVRATGRFGVNILARDQAELAREFARSGEKPFSMVGYRLVEGVPFLEGAIARLACRTTSVAAGGDHDVFIAEVVAVEDSPGDPLLYYDRNYRAFDG